MTVSSPVELPELYDFVLLCGQPSPGLCKLSGFKRAQKWDVKDGNGQDGATTTLTGDVIAKGTITIQLWQDDRNDVDNFFAEYDEWRKIFLASIGNKSKGLDIYHPDLARLGISSICIEAEGQLQHDGKGGATVAIDILEFKPPKPKPATTPDGSKTKKKDGPDPDQDLLDRIQKAKNQGKAAAAERGGDSVFFPDGSPKGGTPVQHGGKQLGGEAVAH